MVALVSFLLVVTLSLIVERVATVALSLTGLSHDAAEFQARSALTGTGFTTGEAESVVSHPARRRIIMLLMDARHYELITGISTLILTFIDVGSRDEVVARGLWLSAGFVALVIAASNRWIDRHLSRLIAWVLRRWTKLDVRDYTTLLGLTSGYTVRELRIGKNSWIAHKRLDALNLPDEGVTVLAVQHPSGEFVGAPRHDLVIRPRDKLILYGRAERLAEMGGRQLGALGDQAHREAVDSQSRLLHLEQEQREATQHDQAQLIAGTRETP